MSERKVEVTLATTRTGPDGDQRRGQKVKVTPAEAKRMAAADQIVEVDKHVETATADPGAETPGA